ncbi:MAG: tetratricopeptide repeat protein [Candidatus Sumerlaeota bacterium]|nr:tetratricopeptide repeat protein [Candidatus Sumerlaeota bacterium]
MSRLGYKTCPVCAEEIREGAKMCRFCFTNLTGEPAPPTVPPEQRRFYREQTPATERSFVDALQALVDSRFSSAGVEISLRQRQRLAAFLERSDEGHREASVIFIDIMGYMSLFEKLEAEVIKREILNPFYEICSQVVDFYNGFVIKFTGDACHAVFGAPVAYDRDAESAVRACLDIRRRVRAFPLIHGARIQIRAGVETGEILSSVITAPGMLTYDVFGASVNLSARIETACAPDTIRIGPATHELVKGVFELRKMRPRKFKNVLGRIVTYEVLDVKEAKVMRRDFTVPFVGRRKELDQLGELWNRFVDGQDRQSPGSPPPAATVANGAIFVGEPGIGKTRLAMEFCESVRDKARTLFIEGAPYGAKIPWGLWRSLLDQICGRAANDSPDAARGKLERAFLALGFEPGDQVVFKALSGFQEAVHLLAALPPARVRQMIIAQIRDLLERLSAERLLILMLDDVQWADAASLQALDALVGGPDESAKPARGVFFLIAHRTGFSLKTPGLRAFERIMVGDLDDASRQALLNSLLNAREIMPEIRDRLLEHAEGNPFYMQELMRLLNRKLDDAAKASAAAEAPGATGRESVSSRELARQIESWTPPTLKEMLQSRIDMLDLRRKLVLQCGAVVGRRFALQIIELIELIREGLLEHLYSLVSLEFLEDDTVPPEGLEFLFRHHLTREVAYRSLLDHQRREFHLIVAQQIEEKYADRLDDLAALLAYHFASSDAHDRAARYLKRAGDQASSLGAVDDAVQYYDDALAKTLHLKPTRDNLRLRATILSAKGKILRRSGDQTRAMECFNAALEVALPLKRKLDLVRLRADVGLTWLQTSHYREAEKELAAAAAMSRGLKDRRLLGMVANGQGSCAWGRGDFKQAVRFFQRLRDLRLEKLQPNLAADALNGLALLEWKAGRLGQALDLFKETLRLRHKAADKFLIAQTLMNQGIIEENLGRLEVAEKHYLESLKLAEQVRFTVVIGAAHGNLANLRLVQERGAEALDHAARSLEIAERIGDRRSAAIALENLALAHILLRQFADARRCLEEGRKAARQIGDAERQFSLDLTDIELRLAEGKTRRIGAALETARKTLQKHGYRFELPRLLRLKALACQMAGHSAEALETAREAIAEARLQQNRNEEARAEKLLHSIER